MMSGVSSRSARDSSQPVMSKPLVSVKSLRQAHSSEPTPGRGEKGVATDAALRTGVCTGVIGAKEASGDGDRGCLCDCDVMDVRRGMMAAISSMLGSAEGTAGPKVEVDWRGPVRPRDLTQVRRPSRAPSKSTVFGSACLVASAAA
jgi:hypothetical protein